LGTMMDKPWIQYTLYAATILLAVLFLFVGNRLVQRPPLEDISGGEQLSARVQEITYREVVHNTWFDETTTSSRIHFDARITTRGARQGEVVSATQVISDSPIVSPVPEPEVRVGSRVILYQDSVRGNFYFERSVRFHFIFMLGALFLVFILAFARLKGFNAVVALAFTCLAVFAVFVPGILAGRNIYVLTLIVCVYAIVSTLVIVIGPNRKTLSAMLGCLGGVMVAAALMLGMSWLMQLTGALDRETASLVLLPIANPIDLRALVFAGVILGAVGAIMDVAMSIASSLWELREAGSVSDFRSIFRSGINIGKDILGTMLNTLILAYIGSSMTLILFIAAFTTYFPALLNTELIIVEFLRALVGSFGMLLTIPLTAGICGKLYKHIQGEDTWSNSVRRYLDRTTR